MTILMVYIVLVIFLIWVCVVSDPNSDSLGTFVSLKRVRPSRA